MAIYLGIEEMLQALAKFWYSTFLSRTRVYPQDISASITLTPGASNIFGDWTLIIPANLIPFDFVVHSLQTEGVSGADAFFVQLANNETPTGAQMLGEKRFRLGAAGRARLDFACPTVRANTPIYGRVKTAAGATTINVSLAVERCVCTPELAAMLKDKRTTWPW